MTFKEFKKWANDRSCDGMWGIQDILLTREIYAEMRRVSIFKKKKYWKENLEDTAISMVSYTNAMYKKLPEEI